MRKSIGICFVLLIMVSGIASGKWEMVREDDFTRDDGVQGDLIFVHAIDGDTVIAAGSNGLVIKTKDGGKSWTAENMNPERQQVTFWGGFFLDKQTGWIAGVTTGGFGGSGVLIRTEDGGETWKTVTFRGSRPLDLYFKDKKNGFMVGETRGYYRTTDSGDTWEVLSTQRARVGDMRLNFEAITFNTPESAWIVGSYGLITHSVDGGENWNVLEEEYVPSNLFDIIFTTKDEGWIVGQDGSILHTVDAGETWELVEPDNVEMLWDYALRSVDFVDQQTGWIVGDCGYIIQTSDGGKTWQELEPMTNSVLMCVSGYKDPETGKITAYAVGETGVVLKFTGE